jgi:hypothetical protein
MTTPTKHQNGDDPGSVNNLELFEQIKARKIPFANHASDLYVMVTDESRKLIEDYEFKCNVRTFVSNIDKKLWFDVPFAYQPFWDRRTTSGN